MGDSGGVNWDAVGLSLLGDGGCCSWMMGYGYLSLEGVSGAVMSEAKDSGRRRVLMRETLMGTLLGGGGA